MLVTFIPSNSKFVLTSSTVLISSSISLITASLNFSSASLNFFSASSTFSFAASLVQTAFFACAPLDDNLNDPLSALIFCTLADNTSRLAAFNSFSAFALASPTFNSSGT